MNDFEREPLYMIGKRESESITEIEFDRSPTRFPIGEQLRVEK